MQITDRCAVPYRHLQYRTPGQHCSAAFHPRRRQFSTVYELLQNHSVPPAMAVRAAWRGALAHDFHELFHSSGPKNSHAKNQLPQIEEEREPETDRDYSRLGEPSNFPVEQTLVNHADVIAERNAVLHLGHATRVSDDF